MDQFSRTELLLGPEAMARLKRARVAVFGVGGVGGYVAEALARSGVGALDLFDDDRVCLTNLNRQIVATRETVGQHKADAMAARLRTISPEASVTPRRMFYMPDNADAVDLSAYDYIVDAVDTVTAKLELARRATAMGVPIISAMGAGNKLDPARLMVADVFQTSVCPLARVMRRELRRRGIDRLKVVYSTEPPVKPRDNPEQSCARPPDTPRRGAARKAVPGSTAFVPAAMGLIIASEIVKDLTWGRKPPRRVGEDG